jgi:PAS domain S-box-containing protein
MVSGMLRLEIIGYPLLISAIVEFLLGISLLRDNPRNSSVNRSVGAFSILTAAFSLITGLMYVFASFGSDVTFLARANWVGWLMIPAGIQFLYYMRDENSKAARIAGYVLYPFWTIVLCISVSTDLIESGNYALLPYIDRSGLLGKPLRAVGVAQLIWAIYEVFRLRQKASGYKRSQLNYFTNGMMIFTVGGTFISGVLPLFGGLTLEPGLGSYFGFPWVVLTYYAITRHRLFDLRLAASRAIAILLLMVLFSGVHIAFFLLFKSVLGDVLAIVLSLSLMATLFFGTSFSRKIQEWIQRLVVKNRYDYQLILKESMRAMVTILDLDELLTHIIGNIKKSLETENICLYLKGESAGQYMLRLGSGLHVETARLRPMDESLITVLQRAGRAVIPEELQGVLQADEFSRLEDFMKAIGAEVIIPMFSKGQVQGFLTLGQKGNREAYLQSDFDLLESLANQAAVAIDNARLYDEARRANISFKMSQDRLQNLIDTTSDWVWEMDDRGVYTYVSPQIRGILGYEPEEVLGKTFFDFMAKDDARRTADEFISLTREKQPFRVHQKTNIRKDGSRVIIETSGVPFFGQDGRFCGYRGIDRDVTERSDLEKRLRYSQKMEAIGTLAGGVAHDFNNILTAIVGHANLLQLNLDKNDPEQEHVDQILASTERAANLIQSLLAFGKKQVFSLKPTNLGHLVGRMEKLLRALVNDAVELRMKNAGPAPSILADASQLERVIINLVVNARDAMPHHGGVITVRTGTEEVDNEFLSTHGFGEAGKYAVITIEDTGVGMNDETRSKIFEPFFTTKSFDKGTGFGLSIAYEIVKQHRGYIIVSSTPGKGTTFTIYLPASVEKPSLPKPAPAAFPLGGSETVLVADNEDDIRKFTRAVLQGFGYKIIEAGDGEEAVERFREHAAEIQLVVLDVIMPKLSGVEAGNAIRLIKPGVKILFTSGYPEEVIQKKGIVSPGVNFMIKPVAPVELLQKVRDIMSSDAVTAASPT